MPLASDVTVDSKGKPAEKKSNRCKYIVCGVVMLVVVIVVIIVLTMFVGKGGMK